MFKGLEMPACPLFWSSGLCLEVQNNGERFALNLST